MSKIPRSVVYHHFDAISLDNDNISFRVYNPSKAYSGLDNEIIVKYTIQLYIPGANLNLDIFPNPTAKMNYLPALRQCWPMTRSIDEISMNLNGKEFKSRPYDFIDAMNRLCISNEESKAICSMSGGEFDDGSCYVLTRNDVNYVQNLAFPAPGALATTFGTVNNQTAVTPYLSLCPFANTNPIMTTGPSAFDMTHYLNEGLFARQNRMYYLLREQSPVDAAAGNRFLATDLYSIDIYERLFVGPFLFYDSTDKHLILPHVHEFTLNLKLHDLLVETLLQFNDNCPVAVSVTAAQLQTKWVYMQSIPKSVTVPSPVYRVYKELIDTSAILTSAGDVPGAISGVFEHSIRELEHIPTMILVFCKLQPDYGDAGSETYLNLQELSLTFSCDAGKCEAMSEAQLYKAYLKNTKHKSEHRISFEQWRKHNCCAVLTPQDIGFDPVKQLDFTVTPIQLNARVRVRDYNCVSANSRTAESLYQNFNDQYWFTIVICYGQRTITLKEDGKISANFY